MRTIKTSHTLVALLCLALLVSFGSAPAQAAVQPNDISGHWAQSQIENMVEQGFIAGTPDGTFGPERAVTRAEFITMINRAFFFTATAPINYSDVSASDWFAPEIARAQAAGYIAGYLDGTMKPNNQIQRQEMAAILAQALQLTLGGTDELNRFSDAAAIPAWSAPACAALVREGYISGYPDGTFQALKPSSRAMAAVTLNQAVERRTTVYNTPGTFGTETGTATIDGNVVVNSGDITLRNLIINGNLIITSKVGQADVILQNVTVKGRTFIKGGDTSLNGSFAEVFMQENHGKVILNAEVAALQVSAPTTGASLDFASGHYGSVTIVPGSQGTKVNIAKGAVIDAFYSYAPLDATGSGTVMISYVYASGITSTLTPVTRILGPGVNAPVNPKAGSSGSSGGGSHPPTLSNVTVGEIVPDIDIDGTLLTFDVDDATIYKTGTATLSRDVDYQIQSTHVPFFTIYGSADTSDNLSEKALDLLGNTLNGGSSADGGVSGANLKLFSDVIITLQAGGAQTVYTVTFQ